MNLSNVMSRFILVSIIVLLLLFVLGLVLMFSTGVIFGLHA